MDVRAVRRAVEADCIITDGFRLRSAAIKNIRAAYEKRGIIVLTDPDTVGERIRARLTEMFPRARHAFVPVRGCDESRRWRHRHRAGKPCSNPCRTGKGTDTDGCTRRDFLNGGYDGARTDGYGGCCSSPRPSWTRSRARICKCQDLSPSSEHLRDYPRGIYGIADKMKSVRLA